MMKAFFVVGLSCAAACGSGTSDTGGTSGGTLGYFPVGIGASWTYRVTNTATGAVKDKASTVEAYEAIGGSKGALPAYRMRTDKLNGKTVSWQRVNGSVLERHREQVFDLAGTMLEEDYYEPFKLRLDETAAHTTVGATWTENYSELITDFVTNSTKTTVKADEWSVIAEAESVTVPAGTYTALHLRRYNAATFSDKQYWFAQGVGKVKETGGGQSEELVSSSIP